MNNYTNPVTVTGNPASFEASGNGKLLSLSVPFSPIQDLHGYSNPWPAGGGANIWDEQWELGSFNSQGEPSGSSTSIRCKNFIPVVPGNTYRYINGSGSSQAPWLYDENQGFIQRYGSYMANGTTITIPEGCYYIKFALPGSYGATYKNDIAWNYPATVTTYSPYSNICPISGRTGVSVYDDPKYGGTIKWNQLIVNGNFDSYSSWNVSANDSFTIANNVATYRASARYHSIVQGISASVVNHVYLGLITAKSYTNSNTLFYIRNIAGGAVVQTSALTLTDTRKSVAKFIKLNQTGSQIQFMVQDNNVSGFGDITVEKAQLFDLTEMFGPTIADYIYGLEQANTGAGVAWFRNLFPKPYYAYNAGEETCVSAVNGDPYTKVSVDWTSEAGTVYGGTLDVTTGVLTVDRATVTLNGSETWGAGYPISAQGCYTALHSLKKLKYYKSAISCNELKTYSRINAREYADAEYGITGYPDALNTYPNQNWLYIKINGLSTKDEYKTWLASNNLQVVYELATPLTYQLTPTQIALILGQNYVWSDSNEAVTLTYVIKLFTRYTFKVNNNDYSQFVERDSYVTELTPVFGETIKTMDGVNHTALLRLRGSITVGLNPQTKANTAAICADILQSPVEVQYHCLQRNANVTALMVADTISAQFLSRCLANGDDWNKIEEITLTEL